MKHTTKDIHTAVSKVFKHNSANAWNVMDMEFLCWLTFMKLEAKSYDFAKIEKVIKRHIRKSNKDPKGKYMFTEGEYLFTKTVRVSLRKCKV